MAPERSNTFFLKKDKITEQLQAHFDLTFVTGFRVFFGIKTKALPFGLLASDNGSESQL